MFKRKCCLPQCDNYFMVPNKKAYGPILVGHLRLGWRWLSYPTTVRIKGHTFRVMARRLICPLHPKKPSA